VEQGIVQRSAYSGYLCCNYARARANLGEASPDCIGSNRAAERARADPTATVGGPGECLHWHWLFPSNGVRFPSSWGSTFDKKSHRFKRACIGIAFPVDFPTALPTGLIRASNDGMRR
jgi:hypothetical protein